MEWISVKDRLPKYGEDVLICCKKQGKRVMAGWYNSAPPCPQWVHNGYDARYEVTHWMPFPLPPKVGD